MEGNGSMEGGVEHGWGWKPDDRDRRRDGYKEGGKDRKREGKIGRGREEWKHGGNGSIEGGGRIVRGSMKGDIQHGGGWKHGRRNGRWRWDKSMEGGMEAWREE